MKRGYKVQIECAEDKRELFLAAGAEIVDSANVANYYNHPPNVHDRPQFDSDFAGNKFGHNLADSSLPQIGMPSELWAEAVATKLSLENYLDPKAIQEIDGWLKTLGKRVVLFHPQGNTIQAAKNIPAEVQAETIRGLLDKTDAAIVLLDWDDRVQRLHSGRVRHLSDDFRKLRVPELAYLIDRASLFIGVDSGPLHLTRFTNTAALGVWKDHHPARFALPRSNTAHLVPGIQAHKVPNRYRRHSFHVIECGDTVTGGEIAHHAARALGGKVGRELVVDHLVDRVLTTGGLHHFADRHKTFRLVLDHLDTKARPQVVETGCIRAEDDWTAGWFTGVVGLFLDHRGGKLDSVDLNPTHVTFAKKWTGMLNGVTIHEADSLKFLAEYKGPKIDVAYLDSLDEAVLGHAEHCLKEAELVLPHLAKDGLILIDDTPWKHGAYFGKGRLAIPFLLGIGFEIVYAGYQVLLRKSAP